MKGMKVTKDLSNRFNELLRSMKRDEVLVGIPEAKSARKGDDEGITNAALLAMCNYGSPANNIVPWPVMSIGIRAAQKEIAEQFRLAAVNVLTKGPSALDTAYRRVGIIASTEIKKTINDQVKVPPGKPTKESLKRRKAVNFKGTKYYIVTGQMRNAITYVIKGEE